MSLDQESRAMLVARLNNERKMGREWLSISEIFGLLDDCDMLAAQAASNKPLPTAQKRAIARGLQAHSVAEPYPWAVVGIGNGEAVHYEVHNLQTGKKVVEYRSDEPIHFSCEDAWDFAMMLYSQSAEPEISTAHPAEERIALSWLNASQDWKP